MALLFAASLGLFHRSMDGKMVFDDVVYLVNNPNVRTFESFQYPLKLKEFIAAPMREGLDPDLSVNFVLRPVAYATFCMNYTMDGYRPRWYRVVNMIIHAVNAMLILMVAESLLRLAGTAKESAAFIAWGSALVFAVHPMALESVSYITQRFASLVALFYLLGLWLYFRGRSASEPSARRWLLTLAAASTLLAMLTQETAFTLPIMVVVIDWLLLGTALRSAVKRAWPLLVLLPVIPVTMLAVHWAASNGEPSVTGLMNITNRLGDPWPLGGYALTQIVVVARYIGLLVWPSGLCIDPSCTLRESILDGAVLAAAAAHLCLLITPWLLLRKYPEHRWLRGCGVFVLWFYLNILPSSSIFPLPDLMAEHRSYLASIGIFVVILVIIDQLLIRLRSRSRQVVSGLTAVAIVGLATATWQRNELWRSARALWRDATEKNPTSWRTWSNLGAHSIDAGDLDTALICFRKGASLGRSYNGATINLVAALVMAQRYQEALTEAERLSKSHTDLLRLPGFLHSVAVAMIGVKRVEDAKVLLERIVSSEPRYRPSQRLLGSVYLVTRQPNLAIFHLENALRLEENDPSVVAELKMARDLASSQ